MTLDPRVQVRESCALLASDSPDEQERYHAKHADLERKHANGAVTEERGSIPLKIALGPGALYTPSVFPVSS